MIVSRNCFSSGLVPQLMTGLSIHTLRPGQLATIVAIDRGGCNPVTARQLHEMGFDEGVDIELLHRGPVGGDPLAVRVGNTVVGLRKSLAAMIVIEPAVTHFREAAE